MTLVEAGLTDFLNDVEEKKTPKISLSPDLLKAVY